MSDSSFFMAGRKYLACRKKSWIRLLIAYLGNFKYMHEKINEPIEVLVKFSGDKVLPTFFKWREKTYKIQKLNLVHKRRDGENKIYYFSVSDDINFFRLAFFTHDMSWKIEELFYEG